MTKITNKLENIKALFLDLDGTIYLGNELIEGALEFLERCKNNDVKCFFLSNNSSRSVEQYLSKLNNLNIPATENDVLLSTHDLINWLQDSNYKRIFLVGTEGMKEMLISNGIKMDEEDPEIVVLGYDTEINYSKLSIASKHLHRGVPLVASHPDYVCPSPEGGIPDVGAYLALFDVTTGVKPVHICGKPNPSMLSDKIKELGLTNDEVGMVGDRIYTDMEMAKRCGCRSILVLSGETKTSDGDFSLIVDSVADLLI
mgnify:CR=1 FL=1